MQGLLPLFVFGSIFEVGGVLLFVYWAKKPDGTVGILEATAAAIVFLLGLATSVGAALKLSQANRNKP
jgi:hypothetical protein